MAISPTFITAFGLIERRVPEAMLTEGVTWVMTGIGIGMALGAFVAGWVVDTFGAQNGFWVSIISGAIALMTVLHRPEHARRTDATRGRCRRRFRSLPNEGLKDRKSPASKTGAFCI